MNPGDYTDLTQPPPSAGLPDLGAYTAYTLVPKRRAPSEDSDTPIECVELIYDEDEQEVPSTFVPQPPVEVHKISFEELTPSSIVCEWKDVQRPEDVDLSFETWRRRIYCLGFRNADRISGRVVYPKDKTYLRGVEWGVTLNPYVAGAFMRGGHMVKQADFPDGTQFYGKLAMHYGLPSYTPPEYYAAFPELEDPTKITKMQNLARDQPTLDNPDQLEPGHGYLVGGYWIKMWNIDSSELVVRWMITKNIFDHLSPRWQDYVVQISNWGTREPGRTHTPKNKDGNPEKPAKRIKYKIGEVDVLN